MMSHDSVCVAMTADMAKARSFSERWEAEETVQALRSETGWDWTFQSIEDEVGDRWHHMPCILSGGSHAYLA